MYPLLQDDDEDEAEDVEGYGEGCEEAGSSDSSGGSSGSSSGGGGGGFCPGDPGLQAACERLAGDLISDGSFSSRYAH